MKKSRTLKKVISIVLTISVLMGCLGSMSVSAAGNMAFSVGCNYGLDSDGRQDIDTSRDALKACDYYALAGVYFAVYL